MGTEILFDAVNKHANEFARHLSANKKIIHSVLRKWQSAEVIDDEVARSIDTLMNIREIKSYLKGKKVGKISVFMPLNLPLYSFCLFAAIPSYQGEGIIVRVPEKLQVVFYELYRALSFEKFYKNIEIYEGQRQDFIELHCKLSDVVVFTGKYENFIKIRELCGKNTLILFNGVGHNPIVVTESADINKAVEKTIYTRLFNNGQDCAAPDSIFVHSYVIDTFLKTLKKRLSDVKVGYNYSDDTTRVGPLFEKNSLMRFGEIINSVVNSGGEIVQGGTVDYKNNVIYPCIFKYNIKQYANYEELFSPIFMIAEYSTDNDLEYYFNDPDGKYVQKQMYVSVFGSSGYVTKKLTGTIPLMNVSIHDIERGTEEYGGYGMAASLIAYKDLVIPKPVLIPREIYTYCQSSFTDVLNLPIKKKDPERYIVESLFRKGVYHIFSDNVMFAYIFGSYARNRAKSYSDIDTFICVKKKNDRQIKEYLRWIFHIDEVFGKIPDFKYPAEIVEFEKLKASVEGFHKLTLRATRNSFKMYNDMVWVHSLSHYKIGIINEEKIPRGWESIFPEESGRILKTFLSDLRTETLKGRDFVYRERFDNFPENQKDIDSYIKNLGNGRKLLDILKYIPFGEKSLYTQDVLSLIEERQFFGRKKFDRSKPFNCSIFRFGVL